MNHANGNAGRDIFFEKSRVRRIPFSRLELPMPIARKVIFMDFFTNCGLQDRN
jgi:hypothetical protein